MPGFVPTERQAAAQPLVNVGPQGHQNISWLNGLKIAMQFISHKFSEAISRQPTVQPPNVDDQAPAAAPATAAPAANVAANAAAANADPAAAVAAAPAAPAFDSSAWLTRECKKIITDLTERTDDGKINLRHLYQSAKYFRDSLVANQAGIRNSLPEALHADFDANIAIIRECFNDPANARSISPNEISFLHAYVNFLKTSIGSTKNELNTSLGKVKEALGEALTQVKHVVDDAQDLLAERTTAAATLREEAETAQAQLELAQQALTANNTQATRNARNVRRQEVDNVVRQLPAATQEVIDAEIALEGLRKLPQQTRVETLDAELVRLRQEHGAIQQTDRDTFAANPADPGLPLIAQQLQEKSDQIREKRLALHAARQDLQRDPEISANTGNLIAQTHARQIERLHPAGPPTFNDHVIQQTERCFKDLICHARTAKKFDSNFLNLAQHFEQQLSELAANENAVLTVPPAFPTREAPETDQRAAGQIIKDTLCIPAGQPPGQRTVFEHALKIVGEPGVTAGSTRDEKRAALLLLGSFCTAQALRNVDPKTHGRLTLIMNSSAQLLAAPLTLRASKAPQTAVAAPDAFRNALISFCRRNDMNDLRLTLNTMPADASNDNLETVFSQGVLLDVTEQHTNNISNLSTLLEKAKTNRTYENDVTALSGKSRQKVFKDSMLDVIEFIKAPPAANAPALVSGGSRVIRATNATLNQQEANILGLLGLNNGENSGVSHDCVNQLVLASIAQNDLSTSSHHVSSGSLVHHIEKYRFNSAREQFKNHNLHEYKTLSDVLIDTAIKIRPAVENRVNDMKARLETNGSISKLEIDQLLKHVIITTDAKAANHDNFNLKQLVGSAAKLGEVNNPANRRAFSAALTQTQGAWADAKGGDLGVLDPLQWKVDNQRTKLQKTLKLNPVKSLPFLNKIPVLNRITSGVFTLAKMLLAGVGTTAAFVAFIPVAAVVVTAVLSVDQGIKVAKRTF